MYGSAGCVFTFVALQLFDTCKAHSALPTEIKRAAAVAEAAEVAGVAARGRGSRRSRGRGRRGCGRGQQGAKKVAGAEAEAAEV